ncbi:N-acetylmuramic acid 6-phosphate phosphatase [Burkholderiales bacterium 8X]|nr:N-acetylmuramic acid 6-phosphate phosphatase [Burkholderiales bacterium 8X]
MAAQATRLSAVLFDLDGTLIDSAPDLAGAADQMRVKRGLSSLPFESYRHMAGSGARGMLGIAFGITPESGEFEAMREEFFQGYEQRMLNNTHVFDGVAELMRAIAAQGLQWGVVTNKSRRFTEPLTGAIPLFATAGAIVSGDSTPFSKPHPAPLLEASRQLGIEPSACMYVGDDERDMRAGRAAGMRTVAAAYGYMGLQADATLWEADSIIGSPLELLNLIKQA